MMDTSNGWNGHDPTLSANHQDDFHQFLDMGMNNLGDGMNFDFQDFANQHNGQLVQQEHVDVMDTGMDGDMRLMSPKDQLMQSQMPPMTSAADMSILASMPLMGQTGDQSMEDLDAQIHFLQQRKQQQQQVRIEEHQRQQQHYQFGPAGIVPPTPTSLEMHSQNNQFYPPAGLQQQAMFDQYQLRLKEQELAFTPLVSPAVTPLESHFPNQGEYTVPGAYFSPLSSPALHAQQEHRSAYNSRLNSPIGLDNMDLNAGTPSMDAMSKKSARKAPSKPKARTVRQSPIVKAQRRQKPGSTIISPQALSDILEPPIQQQSKAQDKHIANVARSGHSTTDGSETDSVSPEQLTDMAPPPLPRSVKNSPFLSGQNGQSRVQQLSSAMSPATPASLMRLTKSQQAAADNDDSMNDDHLMEGFALPEPANTFSRPSVARIETELPASGQTTPTMDSARTSGFALPSPSIVKLPSTKSSPQIRPQSNGSLSAASTPNVRITPKLAAKAPGSTGPTAKKRQSISSASILASPALRPRISPVIKPLIRNGVSSISNSTISDDTASLLLASKSNYQNILEGTHLPGVSYPTELSTNLTSKRTSHKIAEQGRRNRINSALAEIATLLPKKSKDSSSEPGKGGDDEDEESKDKDEKSAGKASGGQSANSKASTVEQAIEYIRALQKEIESANKRADDAEKKLLAKAGSPSEVA